MGLEARETDADEPQRARAVVEGAVEEFARELGDPLGVVRADGKARRAAADREVRVAHLRRHRAGGLAFLLQVLGEPDGHSPQLVLQLRSVGDVALERLLGRDRDALRDRLQRSQVDAAGSVAQEKADLAGQEPPQVGVGQGRELTDRLHARSPQSSLRARADSGEPSDVERREERRLASWRDDRQPAGLAAVAPDLRDHLRGRDADRGAQTRRAPDRGLNGLRDGARLAERVRDLAEVEVALVEARALDRGHDLADGAPDRGRVLAVDAVARPDENGVRAPAQRLCARHRRPDPELARFVIGRCDDPAPARIAADDERLRAQLGVLELLDGGEERVQIEVPEDHGPDYGPRPTL